jgi:hypothetical protein
MKGEREIPCQVGIHLECAKKACKDKKTFPGKDSARTHPMEQI